MSKDLVRHVVAADLANVAAIIWCEAAVGDDPRPTASGRRRARHAVWLPKQVLVTLAVGLIACSSVLATGRTHQNGTVIDDQMPAAFTTPTSPASSLGRLAFVRGGDIWLKALPDGQEEQLTTNHESDDPRWSTSGAWLAVRRRTSGSLTTAAEVSVLPAAGGDRHVLGTTSRGGDSWWAPSSDRLTFIEDEHAVVVNANGTERLELPNATSVSWSPDGAWLAYVRDELLTARSGSQPPQHRVSIWRVRSDGTDIPLVLDCGAPSPDFLVLAGWSPDGAHILFWRNQGFSGSFMAGGLPLESVPVAGGARVPIAPKMLAYPDFLAWAPDGHRLALVQGGRRTTWTNKGITVGGVAAPVQHLSAEDHADLFPAWSPDGHWLAYTTAPATDTEGGNDAKAASSQRRIAIMRPDGTGQHLLANVPDAQDERPRWSRDGQTLLFSRVAGGQQAQLWLMRADGSDPHQIADQLDVQALTGFSADVDPAWFGYYGYLRWYRAYDWWQPAVK